MRKERASIQKLHVTTGSVRLRKPVSQVVTVRKTKEDKKNLSKTTGIAKSKFVSGNLKLVFNKEMAKTSSTSCDSSTLEITRKRPETGPLPGIHRN